VRDNLRMIAMHTRLICKMLFGHRRTHAA
jgi:hypothetical protein